jgi:hypothetical protein
MENSTAQLTNNFTNTRSTQIKSSFVSKVVLGTLGLFMAYHTLISAIGFFN